MKSRHKSKSLKKFHQILNEKSLYFDIKSISNLCFSEKFLETPTTPQFPTPQANEFISECKSNSFNQILNSHYANRNSDVNKNDPLITSVNININMPQIYTALSPEMKSSTRITSKLPIRIYKIIKSQIRPKLCLLNFIYYLLQENHNSIRWVDKESFTFKIFNPQKLTRMWGQYKVNPKMSFDSLSRSLRLSYKSGKLIKIPRTKNTYKFTHMNNFIEM